MYICISYLHFLFHRLRCKKALNDTKVGVKFRKVSKTNICQSCGNPWSLGKYKLKIKKTFKSTKIKKVLKGSKSSKKLNLFNKHILERYSKCQSNVAVQCRTCFKQTSFPTPLPPREAKPIIVKEIPALSKNNQQNKKQKKGKLDCVLQKLTPKSQKPSKKQDKQKILNKHPTKVTKPSVKQQFSKNQLKSISKNLTQNASGKASSLQSFLNSVK